MTPENFPGASQPTNGETACSGLAGSGGSTTAIPFYHHEDRDGHMTLTTEYSPDADPPPDTPESTLSYRTGDDKCSEWLCWCHYPTHPHDYPVPPNNHGPMRWTPDQPAVRFGPRGLL